MPRIANSNIVTAFEAKTIGAKVLDAARFHEALSQAILAHDFSKDRTPGQAILDIAGDSLVSGGIGRRTQNPDDYICRRYREQVHMFLKREHAAPVKSLRAVVYTVEAYLLDPDVVNDPPEAERFIKSHHTTHVLVAVLASPVESFVSPYRFVANLAGGNRDYAEGRKTYSELVALAAKVKAFDDTWAVVAD